MLPPELKSVEDALRGFVPRGPRGPRLPDAETVWRQARDAAATPAWRSPILPLLALAACALAAVLYLTFSGSRIGEAPPGMAADSRLAAKFEQCRAWRRDAVIWTVVNAMGGLLLCVCLFKLYLLERKSQTPTRGFHSLAYLLLMVFLSWLYPRHVLDETIALFSEQAVALPAFLTRYRAFGDSDVALCMALFGSLLVHGLGVSRPAGRYGLCAVLTVYVFWIVTPAYNLMLYHALGNLMMPMQQ